MLGRMAGAARDGVDCVIACLCGTRLPAFGVRRARRLAAARACPRTAFGTEAGIALSALLLKGHNVAKVIAYRRTIPLLVVAITVILTLVGTAVGAQLLLGAPETWMSAAIILAFALSFVAERIRTTPWLPVSTPLFALTAGATSGFSGTSGPLKGMALRNRGLDRAHLVGAASVVSLAGDAMKTAIFARAGLLDATSGWVLLLAIPLMLLATLVGRRLNRRMGERAYAALFGW